MQKRKMNVAGKRYLTDGRDNEHLSEDASSKM